MTTRLSEPFSGSYAITQAYGLTTFTGEPPGFVYPDGSLDYYTSGPGAVRHDHVHSGIDYAVPEGTPILAAADGTVSFAGQDATGYGLCLKIDHGTLTTLCAHLHSISVSVGQAVKVGQQVAVSNNTGNSTGAHLHFSVIRTSDGRYVDPSPYLSGAPSPPPKHLPDGITMVEFQATIMPGMTRIFDGPSTRLTVIGEAAPGNMVRFNAFARGEPRLDPTTGKYDARWYHLRDSLGWVSSSRVVGNAPGSSA